MSETYYKPADLSRFAEMGEGAPELWKKFSEWYGAVFAEGALTEREKSLIALAVAHAVQCPYCIDAYTQGSLEKGASREQMAACEEMGIEREDFLGLSLAAMQAHAEELGL